MTRILTLVSIAAFVTACSQTGHDNAHFDYRNTSFSSGMVNSCTHSTMQRCR